MDPTRMGGGISPGVIMALSFTYAACLFVFVYVCLRFKKMSFYSPYIKISDENGWVTASALICKYMKVQLPSLRSKRFYLPSPLPLLPASQPPTPRFAGLAVTRTPGNQPLFIFPSHLLF